MTTPARTDAKSTPDWPAHGGRIAPLLSRHGLPADHPVIDFSANLNPLGPPPWLGDWLSDRLNGPLAGAGKLLSRYPDPDDGRARQAIAAHDGVAPERVLVTNGGIEAIHLAAALHAGGRALVIEPTFSEYALASRRHGLEVERLALEPSAFRLDLEAAESALAGVDVAFLCRPNNPSGTLIPRADVERLLARADETRTTLVVDEAFVDFTEREERLTPLLERSRNLLLLRSLTKLFDVPGLRLGYLLGAPETVERLAALQMPWSVNALALALTASLLADEDYLARTRAWLATERDLPERVRALGYTVPETHANFLLLRGGADAGEAGALFAFLLERGLLARHTHGFPGLDGAWLRLALRGGDDNARLLEALAAWRRP
ncbi:threonine-phosphate decarboxylase CobD [Halomonas organivorans]|uniref:threonine-phosphate decarboxylase n=1 Tax=Halomonas organivorans TaxID=257772 RepID=A0A7W5C153_9GAMM|nr:threonine-phosphate decarboxylase CobD [Halomonas organivorans]MBB3142419.1 threonine-phosphate decarboxylase [Halomonas organivorans]